MTATPRNSGNGLLEEFRPFTLVSVIIRESPVMLPPGRARSATWLLPSGSA